jgi:hypothetical protein
VVYGLSGSREGSQFTHIQHVLHIRFTLNFKLNYVCDIYIGDSFKGTLLQIKVVLGNIDLAF